MDVKEIRPKLDPRKGTERAAGGMEPEAAGRAALHGGVDVPPWRGVEVSPLERDRSPPLERELARDITEQRDRASDTPITGGAHNRLTDQIPSMESVLSSLREIPLACSGTV